MKEVINDSGGSALPDDFKLTLDGNATTSGTAVPVASGGGTAADYRRFVERAVLEGIIEADSVRSREHILLSNLVEHAWRNGQDLDLATLLAQIQKLREENQSLHARQEALVTERAALVAKNDEARTKVEAMINRLKGLEQS